MRRSLVSFIATAALMVVAPARSNDGPHSRTLQATTVTTLTSSANPSRVGQNITLTASVVGQSPTGTVTFDDGGALEICSNVALISGTATCQTSGLNIGMHSITAIYFGDSNNDASESNVVSQAVNSRAISTTNLMSSMNPSGFRQSVTFTATVAGESPFGAVTFSNGLTDICTDTILSDGIAVCTTSDLAPGTYSISAFFHGDINNDVSQSAVVSQVVNDKAITSTTLSSSTNPSRTGQSVTFAATVAGVSPTGSITFTDDWMDICSNLLLSEGVAYCTTSNLTAGMHSITATYHGDINNDTSESSVLSQEVKNKANTTTIVVSSLNPSVFGMDVTLQATVAGESPTGAVSFKEGATIVCEAIPLHAGSANCPTSKLAIGSHSFTAMYSGDDNNLPSTSPILTQIIDKAPTVTTLISSLNPSIVGQNVTFTASVAGQAPTGTVTFKDGTAVICEGISLDAGSASCARSTLAVGGHSVMAIYSGDLNNAPSTSAILTQSIDKTPTITAVMSSLNPSTVGQNVTFAALVAGQAPTGTVTFKEGVTPICEDISLDAGSANCSTSTLAVGSHSVNVVYSGDSNNAPSISSPLTQTVEAKTNTSTNVSTSCMTTFVAAGQPFTFEAAVTGSNPTGTIDFLDGADVVAGCTAVQLNAATASCTTSNLASVAIHNLTASYSGDTRNSPSTSGAVVVTLLDPADVVFRNGAELELPSCPIE